MNQGGIDRRLAIIQVNGADAGTFLSAQLTNDVMRLGPDRHFLASWCDAKGRALMIVRVVEQDAGYLLLVPRCLLDGILKRLQMFVLRARVELVDATDRYRIHGINGNELPPANRTQFTPVGMQLGLPTDRSGQARALEIADADLEAPGGALATESDAWQLQEIDAGLPILYPPTQGLFVPQMLNLHWLLAIDFDKGCYPGQEVIARLHYRGRLIRRLYRMRWQGTLPEPGSTITDASTAQQGTVIRAARTGPDAGRLLAVLKIGAAESLLATDNARLEQLELPYPTPA